MKDNTQRLQNSIREAVLDALVVFRLLVTEAVMTYALPNHAAKWHLCTNSGRIYAELINNKMNGRIILCIIGIDKKERTGLVRNTDATPNGLFDDSMNTPKLQFAKKALLS